VAHSVLAVDDPQSERTRTVATRTVDEWQAAVSNVGASSIVRTGQSDGLTGQLRTRTMSGVHISELSATAQFVDRTARLVELHDSRDYIVHVQTRGSGRIMQDGRDALLTPAEFAVYDLHRPVSLTFEGPFTCLSLRFSGDMLELPRPLIAQITATKVSEDDGVAGVAAAFFVALGNRMGNVSGRAGMSLARNAVDLVNTVLRDQLDATARAVPIRRGVLVREVLNYIDANLGDPKLSPSAVASAHFISTRHVHAIFRDLGVTVSEWILRRRLEQCRRELTDPRTMGDSVASIAAKAGLSSASYFSQAFRRHFGESAIEVRNQAMAIRSMDRDRL